MLKVDLHNAAGRTAYLAGFHAAQALISEKTGKSVKTHRGVHSNFDALTKGDPHLHSELKTFLSRTYRLKSIADYEIGPGSEISLDRAKTAADAAARFVAYVEKALGAMDERQPPYL